MSPALRKLLIEAVAINSKAWVSEDEKDLRIPPERWQWKEGNQTEISLMSWLSRLGIDINLERVKYPIEKSCPFDSIKKQSSVIIALEFITQSDAALHAMHPTLTHTGIPHPSQVTTLSSPSPPPPPPTHPPPPTKSSPPSPAWACPPFRSRPPWSARSSQRW